jgi:hypothetical protein
LLYLTNFYLAIGIGLFFFLPFVFPNGRFVPRQFRWIIISITVIYSLGYLLFIESPEFSTVSAVITLIWILLSVIAIPYRFFRVSNPIERQQTKWISIGILTVMITASFYTYYVTAYPPSQPSQTRIVFGLINLPAYALGYGFFGFSILMAIIRNRLWDVDIIIRRTLQYGLLSSILAFIYFGSVVLVQSVVNGISGRTQTSQLTIALSTLLIAALFNPIRRRIQSLVDRRFYRRKYDAVQTLAQFAATARDGVDLEKLTGSIQLAVEQTLQPESISVWLPKTNIKQH